MCRLTPLLKVRSIPHCHQLKHSGQVRHLGLTSYQLTFCMKQLADFTKVNANGHCLHSVPASSTAHTTLVHHYTHKLIHPCAASLSYFKSAFICTTSPLIPLIKHTISLPYTDDIQIQTCIHDFIKMAHPCLPAMEKNTYVFY